MRSIGPPSPEFMTRIDVHQAGKISSVPLSPLMQMTVQIPLSIYENSDIAICLNNYLLGLTKFLKDVVLLDGHANTFKLVTSHLTDWAVIYRITFAHTNLTGLCRSPAWLFSGGILGEFGEYMIYGLMHPIRRLNIKWLIFMHLEVWSAASQMQSSVALARHPFIKQILFYS